MRGWQLLLTLSLLALSGCLDSDPGGDNTMGDDPAAGMAESPPESLHFEGSGMAVGDAVTGSGNAGCATGDTACTYHPFTLDRGWRTTLTLVGTPGPASDAGSAYYNTDYDLFLYDGENQQIGSSTNPTGEEDQLTVDLPAGTYTVEVVAWHDIDGSYTLDIEFA